ncbi:HAD-IIIA family hydrolase [Oscillatoria sp. FACHB-1407]|uniref:KdsC family phosphatase n=1 Tax=Oscillatoria sp. FACHB-1407 TaxID=2692847 RepID=UPI001682FD76|nr:HAD-IIIA family hydrolase [Oscillatoria sp. FACHB-1407]MBD2460547.1 HAD-IIIA family hydrolase [Oscillatoria sp. FACHB-1407]
MYTVPKPVLRERLSRIKLLALDVDGVLTDGGLYYTDTGIELKRFNAKDGQGIQMVMKAGIRVAIVTTTTSRAVVHRAQRLGVRYVFTGIEDKLTVLKDLCNQLKITLAQVAYVGDDIIDLPILKIVGCPLTVADAMPENQDSAIYITRLAGGQGCVREICNILLEAHAKA